MNTQRLIGLIKKYPLLLVSLVVCVILLLSLFMRSGLIEDEQESLAKLSAEIDRQSSNISNSAMLQDQLDYLIQANQAVKQRSLVVGGLAQNLQYFYRLESEVGIKYLDLRPGARPTTAKGDVYTPLNYIVNIQGDFVQIITFLRHLERGAYFSRINTAVVSASGDLVTLNLNIDLLGAQ